MSEQYEAERENFNRLERLPGMIAGAQVGGPTENVTAQPALERAREQVVGLTKQIVGLTQELGAYLHTRLGPVNELAQAQSRQSDGERERAKPSGLVNDLLASIERARLEATRMQALIVRLQQL